MKKPLLTIALVSTAALFSMAADDCSGSNVESCTTDADCTTEGQACAIAEDGEDGSGTCVTPECSTGTDCDLMDTGTGSPIYGIDQLDAGNTSCEDEAAVTIIGFDGEEYCAIEPSEEQPCEGAEASATRKSGGTVTVCVLADGTCNAESLSCE